MEFPILGSSFHSFLSNILLCSLFSTSPNRKVSDNCSPDCYCLTKSFQNEPWWLVLWWMLSKFNSSTSHWRKANRPSHRSFHFGQDTRTKKTSTLFQRKGSRFLQVFLYRILLNGDSLTNHKIRTPSLRNCWLGMLLLLQFLWFWEMKSKLFFNTFLFSTGPIWNQMTIFPRISFSFVSPCESFLLPRAPRVLFSRKGHCQADWRMRVRYCSSLRTTRTSQNTSTSTWARSYWSLLLLELGHWIISSKVDPSI